MTEDALDWFASLCSQCSYIERRHDRGAPAPDLPAELRGFIRRYGAPDIDGIVIGDAEALAPSAGIAEQLALRQLRPFARERHGSDYFCLNAQDEVVRWFHDGARTGKRLAPSFSAFLVHRCLLLCDRPEAFTAADGDEEAGAERALHWASALRALLEQDGADLSDPWWPVWR